MHNNDPLIVIVLRDAVSFTRFVLLPSFSTVLGELSALLHWHRSPNCRRLDHHRLLHGTKWPCIPLFLNLLRVQMKTLFPLSGDYFFSYLCNYVVPIPAKINTAKRNHRRLSATYSSKAGIRMLCFSSIYPPIQPALLSILSHHSPTTSN